MWSLIFLEKKELYFSRYAFFSSFMWFLARRKISLAKLNHL